MSGTTQKQKVSVSRRVLAFHLASALIVIGWVVAGLLLFQTATGPDASGYISILFVPIALIGISTFTIGRLLRPVSLLEGQLCSRAARRGHDQALKRLPSRGSIAVGWNRLVERLRRRPPENLEERLRDVLQQEQVGDAQQIIDSIVDGILLTDDAGRITMSNIAAASVLGEIGDKQELTGREAVQILKLPDEYLETNPLPDNRHRSWVCETERENRTGSRTLRIARFALRESVQGHVWTIRDITQQKLANQMRDQFVDCATHELRTPLANIKAYAETLAQSDALDVEQQHKFCNIINVEATRLARFIDDLLDISSIEAGALSVDRKKCEFVRLIDQVTENANSMMENKDITFEVELPDKLPELVIDKDKISSTLVNLLGNAAKYTPEGGRVVFKIRQREDTLEMEVEDSGVGISEEELPRVFDKFFRSHDPRVQAESGTGLGLSLAREIIHLHGGDLTVRSQLDVGTTFTVTLPLNSTNV